MSWQQFKDNVLKQVSEGVADTDTVASIYATEYDSAIKRGYDKINKISIETGNVATMKQLFKSALEKGLQSTEPYDLIGEMGKGVQAYWSGAIMKTGPAIPITLPPTATANLKAVTNIVTNIGQWTAAVDTGGGFKLSPNEVKEIKQELKYYKEELKKDDGTKALETKDIINLNEGKLENNENISVELDLGDEVEESGPTGKFDAGAAWPPQRGGITAGGAYSTPYTPPSFPANAVLGEKIVIAARADVGVAMETEGNDNGPRIREIVKHAGAVAPVAWCASAVTWWWDTAGASRVPDSTNPRWVPNWMEWGKKNGQFSTQPAIGAAVLYDWQKPHSDSVSGMHIGIVSAINSDGSVNTIEGNTSGKQGGGCYERRANMKYIVGYVWPK
jgi:hypothetical protein